MTELMQFPLEEAEELARTHVCTIAGRSDVICAKVSSCKSISKPIAGGGVVYQVKIEAREPTGKKAGFVTFIVKLGSSHDVHYARSFQVEGAFYKMYSPLLVEKGLCCPLCLSVCEPDDGGAGRSRICMTHLQGSVAARGGQALGLTELMTAVHWLAKFHALFWADRSSEAVCNGLWPNGCFWNLERTSALVERMSEEGWVGRLRMAARAFDDRLKADAFMSICHGDPKPDNMLFKESGTQVGMFDFQWAGRTCVAKDLAFCISHARLPREEELPVLRAYHSVLHAALADVSAAETLPSFEKLVDSFDLAYCDFARYLVIKHPAIAEANLRNKCEAVLDLLDAGVCLSSAETYCERVFAIFPL